MEKMKSVKPNQVVEDKDKSKDMDICDFKVINVSKESLASLENSQWVGDAIIKLSLAIKQKEINKITENILFVSVCYAINQGIERQGGHKRNSRKPPDK